MPYPFQNNIAVLEKEEKVRCLDDLIDAALEARTRHPDDKPKNFDEWNVRNVGKRLNEIFSELFFGAGVNYCGWARRGEGKKHFRMDFRLR